MLVEARQGGNIMERCHEEVNVPKSTTLPQASATAGHMKKTLKEDIERQEPRRRVNKRLRAELDEIIRREHCGPQPETRVPTIDRSWNTLAGAFTQRES